MPSQERITPVHIEEEMKTAYLDYAMSVIVGRALPDVRDGLKPVHRRILYAMFREGLLSNRRYSKCAGVVGEVLKKYHPHGDTAVYDALVRMVQEFNMRYPLVDGQGNFGSVDGDSAAAYRYTEARLQRMAEDLLADIDMETVEFSPNFDDSTVEPVVLPTRIPELLINGSSGIAVGMATNIPPHNLGEIVSGLMLLMQNPDTEIDELMGVIKGPDFPTAGFLYGTSGIVDAYRTGRGSLTLRARAVIERHPKTERESIIVTEIPYQVNKARLLEKIAELVRERRIEGISDLRDESDREGMRIVIELKKNENANVLMNQLYKHTQMQNNFGVIMLSLVNNQPRVLNLKQMLSYFLDHRREVVTRRCRFELRKAEEKAHVLEGLLIALEHLDEVIRLIRASQSPDVARQALMSNFSLSQIQAQAILDMRLQRLTALEREKLTADYQETIKRIEYLKSVLASSALLDGIVKEELTEVKERYQDERRTEIIPRTAEIGLEDMIASEDMVITVTHSGYIKRTSPSNYRSQRRGGKGKIGMDTRDEDFVEKLFVASTKDYLLFFTDAGRVFWKKVYEVPEASRLAKGKHIHNILQLGRGDGAAERVTAILPVAEFQAGRYIMMATRKGVVKKTGLEAFSKPRAGGIIALTLEEGDSLRSAQLTDGDQEVLLASRRGLVIRFSETKVRAMGRTAAGVRGLALAEGDEVITMEVVDSREETTLLTVTEGGYGKRTLPEAYRTQGRGGKGVFTIRITPKNGPVIAVLQVEESDEVIFVTEEGNIMRMSVRDIRVSGRNTQGVKLVSAKQTRVAGVALLCEGEESEESEDETS